MKGSGETTLQKIAKTILRHPFLTVFNIGILLFFIAWALIRPVSEAQKADFAPGSIFFVLIFWIFVGGLVCSLQDSYITYISEDELFSYRKILLKVENSEVVAAGDCFWGREGIHKVLIGRFPFDVLTSIVCRVSPYCRVTVPVVLTINPDSLLDPYDYQELYVKLVVEAKVDSVKDFVNKLIEKSIGKSQQIFNGYAKEYTDQKISSNDLLQKIIALLNFPNKALSNFDSFKIRLGAPEISTCKGSSENVCYS